MIVVSYGVFSPINRLHSSNSEYMGKEPWKKSWAVNKISEEFLRLRHKMIPYLYTANYRTHTFGEPICMPMYYRYDTSEAYEARDPSDTVLLSPDLDIPAIQHNEVLSPRQYNPW